MCFKTIHGKIMVQGKDAQFSVNFNAELGLVF
jgi:hypothetical protein